MSQLDDARSRLTKAAAVSSVVATILEGPQTYLVLASNNAEMRAGSGSFLEVGVATTGSGSVQVGDLVPSGSLTLPPGAVQANAELERNWGWLDPGVDWRNLGVTPQFDVTAPLAAQMWHANTGQQVNGVIALDIEGLKQLLVATGPVTVAGSRAITSDNVEQYLLHDQYEGLTDSSTTNTTPRRPRLTHVRCPPAARGRDHRPPHVGDRGDERRRGTPPDALVERSRRHRRPGR